MTLDFIKGADLAQGVSLSGGKVIATGEASSDFAAARFNSDGSLDTAFGTSGKVRTDFFGGLDSARGGVVLQPSGKIVVSGSASSSATGKDFALVRYNP